MNVEQLEAEIKDLQKQIDLVEKEQVEFQQNLPVLNTQKLSTLVSSAKASAVALAEIKPKLTGLEDAHDLLTRQLGQKHSALTQLKKEQSRQQWQQRVKVGRVKIQDQVEKIHDLAALLESAFWELKSLHQEFGGDYRALQFNPSGSLTWSPQDLIKFSVVQVPTVVERGDRFFVTTRNVDLFKLEKDAAQQAQLQKDAAIRERRESTYKAWQLQEAAATKRQEIERIQALLTGKRQELEFFERQVASFAAQGYKQRGSNLKLDDSAIQVVKLEIEKLETQLKDVQNSV